jgi:type IV secretion system protein VirB6
MSGCRLFDPSGVASLADTLRSVDCMAASATAQGFDRLFGTHGALTLALTLILTLYVALLAVNLLTGRSTLSLSVLTPRAMGLGLALTFATSWLAYQSVVWNLAAGAPDQLASLLLGVRGSATDAFANRLDRLFAAVADAAQTAQQAGVKAPQGQLFTPPDILWLGAFLLLLGTVGVLIIAKVALAALLALGPVFVILALFPGTRGLFEGWLKAVAAFALTPLFAVLIGAGTLVLLDPIVASLDGGEISMRAAMTLFLAAFVYCGLMLAAARTATMVTAGWQLRFREPQPRLSLVPAAARSMAISQLQTVEASIRGRPRLTIVPRSYAPAESMPADVHRSTSVRLDGRAAAIASPLAPAAAGDRRAQGLTAAFRRPLQCKEGQS